MDQALEYFNWYHLLSHLGQKMVRPQWGSFDRLGAKRILGGMRTVEVPLGNRSYPIQIGQNALKLTGSECARMGLRGRCAIITDETVRKLYGELLERSMGRAGFDPTLISIPVGEKAKSLLNVERCYSALAEHRMERGSFVVALGGGVVGDLAGFVAATYLRGIGFVQVPTTLLAQVDSSVGGKVGVNLKAGKNLVGAFYQPRLVICDLTSLKTLSAREFRSGLAEVIKYGIIYDAALFGRLEREMKRIVRQDVRLLSEIIARCCQIKAEVVGQDETESGLRAILNFGHTIGHALEAILGYGKLLHGEAISIGQVAAARLSARLRGLPDGDVQRIIQVFEAAGLPVKIELSRRQRERLFEAMKLDKKVVGGEVKFVLAERIGKVDWGCPVPERLISEVL